METGIPTAILISTDDGQITIECPYCGMQHIHSDWGDIAQALGSHRAPHCQPVWDHTGDGYQATQGYAQVRIGGLWGSKFVGDIDAGYYLGEPVLGGPHRSGRPVPAVVLRERTYAYQAAVLYAREPGMPRTVWAFERWGEIIGDLLCDLHHLADELDLGWADLLERGEFHHEAELDPDRFRELNYEPHGLGGPRPTESAGTRASAQQSADSTLSAGKQSPSEDALVKRRELGRQVAEFYVQLGGPETALPGGWNEVVVELIAAVLHFADAQERPSTRNVPPTIRRNG